MKNEDRIAELLSESLKRQDEHTEILREISKGQQILINLYKKQDERFDNTEIEIKNIAFYLSRIFDVEKRMNDFEDRISKLEGHE